jgi:hypothetical protein
MTPCMAGSVRVPVVGRIAVPAPVPGLAGGRMDPLAVGVLAGKGRAAGLVVVGWGRGFVCAGGFA